MNRHYRMGRDMRLASILSSLVLALFVLAACQTLSKEECVAADWRVIGEQDGAQGFSPQNRFGDHAKACEKAGIVPDQSLWNAGYQTGLIRFCTPLSGLAHGQAGKGYSNVCPIETDAAFRSGYDLGSRQKRKQDEINSINRKISSSRASISNQESLIEQGKVDQKEAERTIWKARNRINDLNRDIGRKEVELEGINREVEAFRFSQSTQISN